MAKLNLAALNKTSQTNISETFSIEEDSVLVDWITNNWLNEVVSNKIPEEKIETKVENTAKICFKPKITLKDLNIETTNEVKKETIIESAIENKQITKQKITLDKSWNWISLKVKPQIVEEKVTDNEIKQEIKNISEIEINNETENKNIITESQITEPTKSSSLVSEINKKLEEDNQKPTETNFKFIDSETNTTLIVEEKSEIFSNYIASFETKKEEKAVKENQETIIQSLQTDKQKDSIVKIFINNLKNKINEYNQQRIKNNLEKQLEKELIQKQKLEQKAKNNALKAEKILLKQKEDQEKKLEKELIQKQKLEQKTQNDALKSEKVLLKQKEDQEKQIQKELLQKQKLEQKAQNDVLKSERYSILKENITNFTKKINKKSLYLWAWSLVTLWALALSVNILLLNDNNYLKTDVTKHDTIKNDFNKANTLPPPKDNIENQPQDIKPDFHENITPPNPEPINQNTNNAIVNENINKDFDNKNKSDKIRNELKQFLIKKYNNH